MRRRALAWSRRSISRRPCRNGRSATASTSSSAAARRPCSRTVVMAERGITPSQTVGPFFHFGLTPTEYDFRGIVSDNLITPDVVGEHIRIAGRLIDGGGNPVPDGMIEIWQADGTGRYAGSDREANTSFKGFGRAATSKEGGFGFT